MKLFASEFIHFKWLMTSRWSVKLYISNGLYILFPYRTLESRLRNKFKFRTYEMEDCPPLKSLSPQPHLLQIPERSWCRGGAELLALKPHAWRSSSGPMLGLVWSIQSSIRAQSCLFYGNREPCHVLSLRFNLTNSDEISDVKWIQSLIHSCFILSKNIRAGIQHTSLYQSSTRIFKAS